MVAYGTHEAEEFLVKGDHLEWVGLENKKDIVRVWDVLEPKTELSSDNNPNIYSYDLNGKKKYTHFFHE